MARSVPPGISPTLLDRLRTTVSARGWPRALTVRRVTAGLLVAVAALIAVTAPPAARAAPTAATVVAAHDLPPGRQLTAADLAVVQFPLPIRPPGALGSVAEASGRLLAGVAAEGAPVTTAGLVGPGNTALVAGPGHVAVPVRLADAAVAELVRPGQRVDVVGVGEHGSAGGPLAENATVITVVEAAGGRDGPGGEGRIVVLALPSSDAAGVASASLGRSVTVTLR